MAGDSPTAAEPLLDVYEVGARRKWIAFGMWICYGALGAHRFYLRRWRSGTAMLALGFAAQWAPYEVGVVLSLAFLLWWASDAIRLPGWIRSYNRRLAEARGGA